ncbi:hypothetical protein YC2023_083743 [Brassica napus]
MDVWVNGKGVKASSDGNGEKEFMISPSRFSPLQDIDEEEETCLEGSGTEVEEGEFPENKVDGKKEKELQVASRSRQQGSFSEIATAYFIVIILSKQSNPIKKVLKNPYYYPDYTRLSILALIGFHAYKFTQVISRSLTKHVFISLENVYQFKLGILLELS